MPYIPTAAKDSYPGRSHFDSAAKRIIDLSSTNSFEEDFGNVFWTLATGIYGDGSESFPTRYHLLNAFSGVCLCMSEEWVRKTGQEPEVPEEKDDEVTSEISLLDPESEFGKIVVSLMNKFPKDDINLRDGCLNYFLTVLMIAAVENGYVETEEVPMLIMEVYYYWYEEVIGTYEDSARDKNGEVFPEWITSE